MTYTGFDLLFSCHFSEGKREAILNFPIKALEFQRFKKIRKIIRQIGTDIAFNKGKTREQGCL